MRLGKFVLTSVACSSLLLGQMKALAQVPFAPSSRPKPKTSSPIVPVSAVSDPSLAIETSGPVSNSSLAIETTNPAPPATLPPEPIKPAPAPRSSASTSSVSPSPEGHPIGHFGPESLHQGDSMFGALVGDAVGHGPGGGPVIWGSIETLFWWVKSAPVVPLVTTNNDPNTIASLSEAGTAVLLGGPGQPISYGNVTGVRGTLGGWLLDNTIGIEGSIFGLPTQGKTYSFAGVGVDNPVIAVPFFSTVPFNGQPAGETSTNPGNVPSLIQVNATTRFWGAEALGLANLTCSRSSYVAVLGGFQYFDLRESLSLDQTYADPTNPGLLTIHDQFSSRNQFYGAATGLRTGIFFGPLGIALTGKVAIGPQQERYTVAGATTISGTAFNQPAGTTLGGTFALPSNSGTFSRNEFVVVPQGQLKVSLDVFRNVRLWGGYDIIYFSNVVRAANQIDRAINPTQNAVFLIPTSTFTPVPTFSRSDFWVQGISAGLQVQY